MPSEIEGLIFPYFFPQNRIFGCLGGILEVSWTVLVKKIGPSWASTWVQLGPQDGSGAAQEPPERSLQITQEASWSQEPPKSRPEPSKTPQGSAQTPSKPRFSNILATI